MLKEKYSLGVVTNGNADLKIIGIDYLFDYCFSAADLNAHKPDPIMFEAVIDKTGLKANEICHVGDHPINDVQGSFDCGNNPIYPQGGTWPFDRAGWCPGTIVDYQKFELTHYLNNVHRVDGIIRLVPISILAVLINYLKYSHYLFVDD